MTKKKVKCVSNKEFEELIDKLKPKTEYRGLIKTKEGFKILKKMTWVEIEELTDIEFFG